jgi:hypothetical protein
LKNRIDFVGIFNIGISTISLFNFTNVNMGIVGTVRGSSRCLIVNCIFLFNFTSVKISPPVKHNF